MTPQDQQGADEVTRSDDWESLVDNWSLIAKKLLPLLGDQIFPTALAALGIVAAALAIDLRISNSTFLQGDFQILMVFGAVLVFLGCAVRVIEAWLRRGILSRAQDLVDETQRTTMLEEGVREIHTERNAVSPHSFVAEKQVTIEAPTDKVWKTLTDPELVAKYMHGTHLQTDWKVGSRITWSGEWHGNTYEDKGKVLAVEPGKLLRMTHWSPMGGGEDKPENYHTVTYELDGLDGKTVLTVKQDNNPTEAAAETMAEKNWGPVLEGLKMVAEEA